MPFVMVIVAISFASAVAAQQSSNTTSNTTLDGSYTCNTNFSVDLYGLGVRLGYYFNWASGWTANNFVPDEIAGAQDSNSVFLLGLLASLLRGTSTRNLTRLDGLVLLELAAGTIWSVLSLWGYRTCVYKREGLHGISSFGGFGTHFRLLLSTMVASYGLWFFIVGIADHNDHKLRLSSNTGQGRCDRIYVLGVRLSNFRPVGIVLCLISLVYCGTMLITSSVAGITRLWKISWLIQHDPYSSSSRLRYISGLGEQQLVTLWRILSLFNLFWIVFAIVFVELTLRDNHIRAVLFKREGDLLTPSQLLPMIIGISSFGRSVYYAYEYFRADKGHIRPSLGFDVSTYSGGPVSRPTSIGGTIKSWLRLLSQPNPGEEKKIDDVQAVHDGWSTWQRILIAWLPWISVLSFWPWNNGARAKRTEGFTDE